MRPCAQRGRTPRGQIGFAVENYDASKPLVIDPTLEYSTYLGGGGDDAGQSVKVDSSGAAYVAGVTFATDFTVKGAAQSVNKGATDACYERMTRLLFEQHDVLRPAFGSHNVRSIAHALALADVLGLPPRSYEIQMLYGMAEPVKAALVSLGRRVRVYTPYGRLLPGMAYLVRRLLENTANESFLRASFTEHVPEEVLLMKPHANSTPAPVKPPQADEFQNDPVTDFSRADVSRAR